MDINQQGIIILVRSSLVQQDFTLPEGFDLEAAYHQIIRHGIITLAYDGALRCGLDKNQPVMQKLFHGYLKCFLRSEGQLAAVDKLRVEFDKAGLDYMPLKGCNLKALYPKPELRLMGDADILIRTEQYECIRPIMEGLGYKEQVESDHELIWDSPALHVELHKRLIPSYNPDYYRYFGDGWRLAKPSDSCCHCMKSEDEYIYIFTHFAKHYRDGGIGCRHVADLWVYRRAYPQLDFVYIDAELDKLQLLEFHKNIEGLITFWFEGAQPNEKTEFISDFIFKSGAWGRDEDHSASAGVRAASKAGSTERGRLQIVLRMLFPTLENMQGRYRILKRCPILLPLIWPLRWVDAFLFRRRNVEKWRGSLSNQTVDKIESYQQALNYVGLNFNFKD